VNSSQGQHGKVDRLGMASTSNSRVEDSRTGVRNHKLIAQAVIGRVVWGFFTQRYQLCADMKYAAWRWWGTTATTYRARMMVSAGIEHIGHLRYVKLIRCPLCLDDSQSVRTICLCMSHST